MSNDFEQLRNAWIDGELSAEEAAAFVEGLGPGERADLEHDQQLDRGIAALLAAPSPCPASAWERACSQVYAAEAIQSRARFDWSRAVLVALPIAAVFVVAFALLVPAQSDAVPTFLKVAGATVPELEQHSAVLADHDQVEQFMRQYGFNLRLGEVTVPDHEMAQGRTLRLVGAQVASYRGETVMLLLFACCNKPAQVVVMLRGGEAERAVRLAQEKQAVRMTRNLCPQYMGAVVGDTDRAGQLLTLLSASD